MNLTLLMQQFQFLLILIQVKAWNHCIMFLYSWIMNFVDESIAQNIVFFVNSIDVWKEQKECFSQGDYTNISEL